MSHHVQPRHRAARTPILLGTTSARRALRAAVGTGLATAVVAGTAATAPSASAADGGGTRQDRIADAFDVVAAQKGDAYSYGADGPDRFDCSGLVSYAYKQRTGFDGVPRTSSDQARFMNRIDKDDLRRGDFLFFYDGAATADNVYHVAVFAGWDDGRRMIIHAPGSGERVQKDRVWTGDWFAGTLRGK